MVSSHFGIKVHFEHLAYAVISFFSKVLNDQLCFKDTLLKSKFLSFIKLKTFFLAFLNMIILLFLDCFY